MEASCSDGWWAFWMGVFATWVPVYTLYKLFLIRDDEDDEDTKAPETMYS